MPPADLEGVLDMAPYLRDLNERHAGWLVPALGDPDAALRSDVVEVEEAGHAETEPDVVGRVMRLAKQRIALLAAAAELTGEWTTAQSTAALSDLADAALHAGLDVLMRLAGERGLL